MNLIIVDVSIARKFFIAVRLEHVFIGSHASTPRIA